MPIQLLVLPQFWEIFRWTEQKYGRRVQPILDQCARQENNVVYNQFSPGFMCVGQKPHPFGNEWHTIYCGISYILCRVRIVEGKDIPEQLGLKLHPELLRTVGLMIQMCEPIFSTGKSVFMESVFVLQIGLLHLRQNAGALVKKRWYFMKVFQGISSTGILRKRRWGM